MKKSFLTIASLAMVLALVGCNNTKGEETSKDPVSEDTTSQGGDVTVPTEEGKLTVYLTAKFDGVELASYASINLAGGFTSWNQGQPAETELTRLEGTDVFYKIVDAPAAGDVYYKVILGYNETSGLTGENLGVNWGNEANGYPDGQFGPGDGGNKIYAFAGTETTVNLGELTWKKMLDEPVLEYYDADLYVDFFEEIPADHHVYLMGALNGWASPVEMLRTDDTEVVRYQAPTFEDLLAKSYEFKVVVHPDASTKEGFDVWKGGFEVVPGANSVVTVNALMETGPRNIFGGSKKFHAANQLDAVMEAAKGDTVECIGKVFAFYESNPYNGVYIGDRDNTILIYQTPDAVKADVKIGSTIRVGGVLDVYNNAKQIKVDKTTPVIEILSEDHNQVVNYKEVTAEYVASFETAPAGDILNNAVHFAGKVASTDSEGATDTEVTLQLEVAEGVTLALYAKSAKDSATTTAALAALVAGDSIEVYGAMSAYKGTYQIVASRLA